MATHQEIAGVSDDDLVQRMIRSHSDRFNDQFWYLFNEHIAAELSESPRILDLGCGPGLLVRDLAERFPTADLYGYDITPAMIDYACGLNLSAQFGVHDLTQAPIPLEAQSVDLIAMAAVLHVLDEPLKCLQELKRLLKPGGIFVLVDWVRQPLEKYLSMMMERVPVDQYERMEQAMLRLSVAHNKYHVDDWVWLLQKGGFRIKHCEQTGSEHFRTFVCVND